MLGKNATNGEKCEKIYRQSGVFMLYCDVTMRREKRYFN